MNDLRKPFVHDFTQREALLMRSTVSKNIGHIVRGPVNISAAEEMERNGLVALENLEKGGPGKVISVTKKGREAWHNAGLRAGGREPVVMY